VPDWLVYELLAFDAAMAMLLFHIALQMRHLRHDFVSATGADRDQTNAS
jgi:hypothetical protein